MQISHELTPQLFNDFSQYNDYDFILPRFWLRSKEYKEHFKKSNKFKILDNGLFEGDNFTTPELVDIVNEVQPDIFVLPDVWNSSEFTFRNAKYWMNTIKKQLPSKTKLMVVMQGKKMSDFEKLYQECKDLGFKYFAFNFSSEAYSLMSSHPNKLFKQMRGRIETISNLYKKGYIEQNDYIHLLGGSLPQEFLYYPQDWKFIKSVDTSNPVINGACEIQYEDWGLLTKPEPKLEEFFDKDLTSKIPLINFNINKFRNFIKSRNKIKTNTYDDIIV